MITVARYVPPTIKELSTKLLDGESARLCLAEFVDDFLSADRAERIRLTAEKPQSVADPKINAYMAAAVEHLCFQHGVPVPAWVNEPEYFLPVPWFPLNYQNIRAIVLAESPVPFRRRNIFVDSTVLQRV